MKVSLFLCIEVAAELTKAKKALKNKIAPDTFDRVERQVSSRDLQVCETLVYHIQGLSRWIPVHYSCLSKSIALAALLSKRNIPSQLKVGIISEKQEPFAAHAWVLVGDAVYDWGVTSTNEFGS